MSVASGCVRWVVAVAALWCMNNVALVWAQDESPQDTSARLDRMEKRLNQMADQQQRLMSRLAMVAEHREMMQPPGGPGREGPREMVHPVRVHWPGPIAKGAFWKVVCWIKAVVLVTVICHILLAVWVYMDIRKRGEGHGIFIVLALLAGFFGAGLYALVRIGERKA